MMMMKGKIKLNTMKNGGKSVSFVFSSSETLACVIYSSPRQVKIWNYEMHSLKKLTASFSYKLIEPEFIFSL